jgi:uncharacterized protein (DUF58 family)
MLGVFAWMLFRKFVILMDDLGDLAERSAVLEVEDPVLARPELAVLADLRVIRAQENARRAHRAEMKRQRHERLIARGRRITSTAGQIPSA